MNEEESDALSNNNNIQKNNRTIQMKPHRLKQLSFVIRKYNVREQRLTHIHGCISGRQD